MIQDALLASSSSFANTICQVLVTGSQSIFSFCLNTNSPMSIWPAVLHSSAIQGAQCSFLCPFLEWTLLNPGWSNFFASLQQHKKILLPWISFLWHRQYEILQLTFWRGSFQKPWWMIFHRELPLGHFYKHPSMQAYRTYACH